jgi:hypothetical protein
MKIALPEPDAGVTVYGYGCARDGRLIEDFVKATGFVPIQNDGSSSWRI